MIAMPYSIYLTKGATVKYCECIIATVQNSITTRAYCLQEADQTVVEATTILKTNAFNPPSKKKAKIA